MRKEQSNNDIDGDVSNCMHEYSVGELVRYQDQQSRKDNQFLSFGSYSLVALSR